MTQCERVFDYMKANGSITPLEAQQELGIMRLGARIWDLKQNGVVVKKEVARERNRYVEVTRFARYRLEEERA